MADALQNTVNRAPAQEGPISNIRVSQSSHLNTVREKFLSIMKRTDNMPITDEDRQKLAAAGISSFVYGGKSIGSARTYAEAYNILWNTDKASRQIGNGSDIDNPFRSNNILANTPRRKKEKVYHPLYDKYYSSSDVIIKVIGSTGLPIWVDKASGIAFSESLGSVPVYTIGDSKAKFFMRGNLSVSGFISINMTNVEYFSKILHTANSSSKAFRVLPPYEVISMSPQEMAEYKAQLLNYQKEEAESKSTLQLSDYPLFNIEMEYNNSDPVYKVKTKRRTITECRIVGFEQGVDIGGDGQLVDGYKFIAKEVT